MSDINDEAINIQTLQSLQNIERLLKQSQDDKDSEKAKVAELATVNVVFCVFLASIDVALASYLQAIIASRPSGSHQHWYDTASFSMWYISIGISIIHAHESCIRQKTGQRDDKISDNALLCRITLSRIFNGLCCEWRDPCDYHRKKLGIPLDSELDPDTRPPMPLGTIYFNCTVKSGDETRFNADRYTPMIRGGQVKSHVALYFAIWLLLCGLGIMIFVELGGVMTITFIMILMLVPNIHSDEIFPWMKICHIAINTIVNLCLDIIKLGRRRFARSTPRNTVDSESTSA